MRKMTKEVVRKVDLDMTRNELEKILDAHIKWLNGEKDGVRANLTCADLSGADLHDADLHGAILYGANLTAAYLSHADLCYVNLNGADLHSANFNYAKLSCATLNDANLECARLDYADLSSTSLCGANLVKAGLTGAKLNDSNLSDARGLLSAIDYMRLNFERVDDGYIVYKTFNKQFQSPKSWEIKPGSVLTENVNFDRAVGCGCGINVAPLKWVRRRYGGKIWRCLIRWEWLPGVCVPYNTDGKIRCERVELLEVMAKRKDNKNAQDDTSGV